MIISLSGRIGVGKDLVTKLIQRHFLVDRIERGLCSTTLLTPLANLDTNMITGSGWEIRKWATSVRRIAEIFTGLDMATLNSREFKNMKLDNCWDYPGAYNLMGGPKGKDAHYDQFNTSMTGRELLIRIGHGIRKTVHEDAWVNSLMKDYKPYQELHHTYEKGFYTEEKLPQWIISDTRYPNELTAVESKGGISIHIERPDNPFGEIDHPSESALDGHKFKYILKNDCSIEELNERVRLLLTELKLIECV